MTADAERADALSADSVTTDAVTADAAVGRPRRGVVALGANLGDRVATLRSAVRELDELDGVRVVAASTPVESVALTLDGLDASRPAYVNAVALVDVTLGGTALLAALHVVEERHGRVRVERWCDRTLDLDLVELEGDPGDGERLVLPHPRAAERSFVLEPWLEVDPEARLTGRGAVADLLAQLPDRVRRLRGEGPLTEPTPPAPTAPTDATTAAPTAPTDATTDGGTP